MGAVGLSGPRLPRLGGGIVGGALLGHLAARVHLARGPIEGLDDTGHHTQRVGRDEHANRPKEEHCGKRSDPTGAARLGVGIVPTREVVIAHDGPRTRCCGTRSRGRLRGGKLVTIQDARRLLVARGGGARRGARGRHRAGNHLGGQTREARGTTRGEVGSGGLLREDARSGSAAFGACAVLVAQARTAALAKNEIGVRGSGARRQVGAARGARARIIGNGSVTDGADQWSFFRLVLGIRTRMPPLACSTR